MGPRNGNKEWTRTSISWRLEQRRHQGFEGYEPLRQREQDTLGTKKTSKNKTRQVFTERNGCTARKRVPGVSQVSGGLAAAQLGRSRVLEKKIEEGVQMVDILHSPRRPGREKAC